MSNNKRYWFLRLLCSFTIIGSGFGLTVSSVSAISVDFIKFTENIPGYTSIYTNTKDALLVYPFLKIILYALSVWGAFLMFKLIRKGYYYYMASQLLLIISSFIMFPYPFSQIFYLVIPEIIVTVAFLGLYALYLDKMNCHRKAEAG